MTSAPDYFEPVVAWRAWKVVRSGGRARLSSLFVALTWTPDAATTARCMAWRAPWRWLRTRHEAPREECDCGIYATTLAVLAEHLTPRTLTSPGVQRIVLGRVSLWGSVVECVNGWRAETAYPERLFVPRFEWRTEEQATSVAADLADYRVPVELLDGGPEDVFEQAGELVRPLVVSPAA